MNADATVPATPGIRGLAAGLRHAIALTWRAAAPSAGFQIGSALLVGVLPIWLAWLSKSLLDGLAAGHRDAGRLLAVAAAMAALGLVTSVWPYLTGYAMAELGRRAGLLAQARLASAVKGLHGLARLEDPAFYDRLRLATQAGRAGPSQVFAGTLTVAQSAVTTGGYLVTLAVLNPWLVLFALLAAVHTGYLQRALSRRQAAVTWRLAGLERREMFYETLLTRLDAAKEIRLFGLADFLIRRMLGEISTIHATQRRMDRRAVRSHAAMALIGAGVTGAGVVWAVSAAISGRLSVGDIAIVLAASAGVVAGLSGIISHLGELHQALILFDHYRTVLATPPDLPMPARPEPVPPLRRAIELRDVWFRYSPDHPWVLKGVNLVIPAGRTVGLVGLNGAGKSTLIKLLCRFYDPVHGSIRWDGVDLRDMSVVELRSRIGAVFQDFMDYDLTAAENIGVGAVDRLADRAGIVAAAAYADIDRTIAALPKGYDTPLTRIFADTDDTGVLISGGQWQRVALARGLLRHGHDLMILDEPSSGLDAEAEYEIHVRLRLARRGRTSVLISHRLSAVRDADLVVVLADGCVVEQGTHETLCASGGPYARLFALQARGYRIEPSEVPR